MAGLKLTILADTFSIHKLPPTAIIPEKIYSCDFYAITKTDQELSIVCPQALRIESDRENTDWSCLKVQCI